MYFGNPLLKITLPVFTGEVLIVELPIPRRVIESLNGCCARVIMYHGIGDIEIGPIDSCHESHSLTLTLDKHSCEMTRAFLMCRYEVVDKCCETTSSLHR